MATAAETREAAVKEKAKAYLAARKQESLGKHKEISGPKLVAEEVPNDVAAWEEAVNQVRKAQELLTLPKEAFLRYPLPDLGDLVGGVRYNRIHYYVSASNNGKTMFVYSFITGAIALGQRCTVMTTETSPADFRLAMAALAIDIDVGDIATGEYMHWPNAEEIKTKLHDELERWTDYESGAHAQLRVVAADGHLTPDKIRQGARDAANIESDWLIIDHVDYVEPTGKLSDYQVSNAVNTAAWRAAMDLNLRVICTSQLNQDVFRKNPLGMCMPPQEAWVKFGGVKKENGWVMLGGYRPLRPFLDDEDRKKELGAFKAGERTIAEITLPCLQIRVMKHRDYGKLVGGSVSLAVRNGRVGQITKDVAGAIHGIRTSRG